MADEDVNTSRTVVKTYVPAYQKQIWAEHADELEMSQSEFIRTMVQAGRCGFDSTFNAKQTPDPEPESTERGVNSEFNDLEMRVEKILDESGPLSWDELIDELTDDIEERLEDVLQNLQSENRVSYSGRSGGYTLNGGQA
jgi:hypothetical protein